MIALRPLDRPHESLFWTAPSPESEFGAEDPLALDYISQQIGLFLLPTLTTRSSRAQSFAMVLYGLDLAERAVAEYGLPDDDEMRRRLFERWERFWALAVLELRGGRLERGDPDAMRGVRGAVRAWVAGDKPLKLDYPLISRQQELGSLGAYLSPLRAAGLVTPGTVRPSPAATDIIASFWDEQADNARTNIYERYALEALDLERDRIERKSGGLTLRRVGNSSRLSALVARSRVHQQSRLYEALIGRVSDRTGTTLPLSAVIEASARENVYQARDIIDGAITGRWIALDSKLRDLLQTARAFGDAMDELLRLFDRLYAALVAMGWQARKLEISAKISTAEQTAGIREACRRFLASPEFSRVQRLPIHGASFVRLATEIQHAASETIISLLLRYHTVIQRERHRGEAWIREQDGHLSTMLTSYRARPDVSRFPTYKLDVLRRLLIDTGRLPSNGPASDEESAS